MSRGVGSSAMIQKDRSLLNGLMPSIVNGRLSPMQTLIPISHVGRNKMTQHILNDPIDSLSLAISLGTPCSRQAPLNA